MTIAIAAHPRPACASRAASSKASVAANICESTALILSTRRSTVEVKRIIDSVQVLGQSHVDFFLQILAVFDDAQDGHVDRQRSRVRLAVDSLLGKGERKKYEVLDLGHSDEIEHVPAQDAFRCLNGGLMFLREQIDEETEIIVRLRLHRRVDVWQLNRSVGNINNRNSSWIRKITALGRRWRSPQQKITLAKTNVHECAVIY